MRAPLLMVSAALSLAAASSAEQPGSAVAALPVAEAPPAVPRGARVEPSGFWTVEQAPASPAQPSAPSRRQTERTFYAELAGVSNAEAARRMREQEALRPTAERLVRQLRARERGNFTEVEIVHKPDWAYLLYFKREPEKTLAKYTRNPRFKARWSRYTSGELRALSKPWIDRFEKERLFTGYGMNARQGTADIDMIVSEGEFAAIAARHGWGKVPAFLRLKFDTAPAGAAVDPRIGKGVRLFPQADRNLGIIHMAGFSGRIALRDGCFIVDQPGSPGTSSLAYFPREVGLYLDPQGYLALRTRAREPRHLGRIGESFSWAGPIGVNEEMPMVRELRARCGNAPLIHLSVPESESLFLARYPHLRRPVPPPPPPPKS